MEKIDNYCGRINRINRSDIGRLVDGFFHTVIRLPDRSFDLHGDILTSVLNLSDDLIVGALKPFGCLHEALHTRGIENELSISFKVSIELFGNVLERILYNSNWLDGFNANGDMCRRLSCRH